jgi:hypothetical protein
MAIAVWTFPTGCIHMKWIYSDHKQADIRKVPHIDTFLIKKATAGFPSRPDAFKHRYVVNMSENTATSNITNRRMNRT